MLSAEAIRTEFHLANLVAQNNSAGANLSNAEYIAETLQGLGHAVVHADNMGVATYIPGRNRDVCLMLQAHYDTVEPFHSGWTSPNSAFDLTATDGEERLMGLGVTDMLGSAATYLTLAEIFTDTTPDCSLILEFVDQEETTGAGTDALSDTNRSLSEEHAITGCLLGEPTGNEVFGTATNGGRRYYVTVQGQGGHSSLFMRDKRTVLEQVFEYDSRLKALELQWRNRFLNTGYAPPTANITKVEIDAGSGNALATLGMLTVDVRMTPSMLAHVTEIDCLLASGVEHCEISPKEAPDTPLCPPASDIRKFISAVYPHIPQVGMPYTTDMHGLQAAGWLTLLFGPGSIETMHMPNETIDRAKLHAYGPLLMEFIRKFAEYGAE